MPIKLIIQIPCFNEEGTLPLTLAALPKQIPGIDIIEYLVVDDGSTDRTVEVAHAHGVHHVVGFPTNKGLARAFMLGIHASLAHGADIIVNTDADNQYVADDIAQLVEPILSKRAEIVIGARPIATIEHFSFFKKILQHMGSSVVKLLSGTEVQDAPSGFRAFSRHAALSLNVFSRYTYTLETIIQAGQKNLSVVSVPIRVNPETRPSRLVRSIPSYVRKSFTTIVRMFVVYRPFRFFVLVGTIIFSAGVLVGLRFLYRYLTSSGQGMIQSLILAAVLLMIGFQTVSLAFIADLLAVNRKLLEELQAAERERQLDRGRAGERMLPAGAIAHISRGPEEHFLPGEK